MIPLLLAASLVELRLDYVRTSLTKEVRHYAEYVDGVPVAGGERIEENGRVTYDRVARPRADGDRRRVQTLVRRDGEPAFVNVNGEAVRAWRVVEFDRPLEPHARFYDAETGALLRDQPLFFRIKGRVFDVNPVAKLNDPSLRDQNNAAGAVPDAAYSIVDLPDLARTVPLQGPFVKISDDERPFTTHADPSQALDALDRSRPEFEEVNAYFQVDRAQRYLQSLGYVGQRQLVAYQLPVDAHAANGTDNSYFIEASTPGRGELFFGDGGTDDAEDSDIVLHEFTHAIQNWIAPGVMNGSASSQALALAEGSADYWAFSSTYDATTAAGRDAACIGDWDARCFGDADSENCGYPADADCLRRVDSKKTMANYVTSSDPGTEHANGAIWSSVLRDIFLSAGKRTTDILVIESFFGLPPSPTFREVAERIVDADRAIRGGADIPTICTAMTSRGILAAADCGTVPRGEITAFPALITTTPIPDDGTPLSSTITISDARTIVNANVRIDIRHARRGDLAISLRAPDGTEYSLVQSSPTERTADVHATFTIDALRGKPANGTWTLIVRDVYPTDTGSLRAWSLDLQLEGDQPAAARPSSVVRKVIPVAGHIPGALGRDYLTDMTVFSPDTQTLTLIYTPSGADGSVDFAAMRVAIAGGATVRFEDIVSQLVTLGIGQLEIAGDLPFIATSHSYFRDLNGTHGDRVAAVPATEAAGSGVELVVARNYGDRWNVGVANVANAGGTVRVNGSDYAIAPHSHIQVPADGNVATIRVVSGGPQVVAYASVIEGDDFAVYMAQRRVATPTPVRTFATLGSWEASAWAVDAANRIVPPVRIEIAGGLIIADGAPAGGAVFERLVHSGQSESIPLMELTLPTSGNMIGIEISDDMRTNAATLIGGDVAVYSALEFYDAAGTLLGSFGRAGFGTGIVPITDPRVARIRAASDITAVTGFASVVDNRSGDARYIPAQ
jgi:subtilisin-like proprotein convertase family protein